jgi:DNA-binding NarL/FixJ family response regulator
VLRSIQFVNRHDPPGPGSLADLAGATGFTTDELAGDFADGSDLGTGRAPVALGKRVAVAGKEILRIGLIDCHQFSRDCLIEAFTALHQELLMLPFVNIQDCTDSARDDLDLIMYYSHDEGPFEDVALQTVTAIRHAFKGVPVIVLSDAKSALQPKTIRNALKSGAQGFIPTRTTEMPVAFAAIRFVKAGGTFAPIDLLLSGRPDRVPVNAEAPPPGRLTLRQMTVLSHLRQGKANKVIAHDLGMSESTVKVHVRNIMRKMGATNRTQAVYKAQQFWSGIEITGARE